MPLNVFYKKGYDTCMYNMLIKETKKKIISIIKRKKKKPKQATGYINIFLQVFNEVENNKQISIATRRCLITLYMNI